MRLVFNCQARRVEIPVKWPSSRPLRQPCCSLFKLPYPYELVLSQHFSFVNTVSINIQTHHTKVKQILQFVHCSVLVHFEAKCFHFPLLRLPFFNLAAHILYFVKRLGLGSCHLDPRYVRTRGSIMSILRSPMDGLLDCVLQQSLRKPSEPV